MIEKNDLILLNEIIYKIYSILPQREMRLSVIKLLKSLIHYNKASFYLAESQPGHLLNDPVAINIPEDGLKSYIENFEDVDYTRWIFISGKCMAYKETDLLSDAKRENEKFYKELYAPDKIHYSAQLSIAYHDTFLGIISLYREKSDGDFTENDLFILDLLKDHLALRLHNDSILLNPNESLSKNKTSLDTSNYISKYHLTLREVEVLGLLLGGLSGDKICEVLVISPHTLKKHTLSIYKKLGVNSRWELFSLEL